MGQGEATYVHALFLGLVAHDDTGCLQLALLLQDGEPAGLFELTFAGLALCLFALGICETGAGFRQHLLL